MLLLVLRHSNNGGPTKANMRTLAEFIGRYGSEFRQDHDDRERTTRSNKA